MICSHRALWQRKGKPPRCVECGHRVAYGTYVPRQTRYQPRLWLTEWIDRHRARKMAIW